MHTPTAPFHLIERNGLDALIKRLKESGYTTVGPTVYEGAIVYDEITSIKDLPSGWKDTQEAKTYRLEKTKSKTLFDFTVGPQSWKKFLYPPRDRIFTARREGRKFEIIGPEDMPPPKYAFIGVRSCEIAAVSIQDTVFTRGECIDPSYKTRRDQVFIVAVNCTRAGGTCFCTSMNTGPRAKQGFDLALTEIVREKKNHLVLEVGSERGAEMLKSIPHRSAEKGIIDEADRACKTAARYMGRKLDTRGIKELLYGHPDHPRWDDAASRCLTCTNCTLVCPTCFCSTVEDVTDLTGNTAERWRRWDSCFTLDFAKVAGGNFRTSTRARYRQWLTHKFASWIDQFGTSGCVGCGRCITWCPAGIDVTEEIEAIRKSRRSEQHSVKGT